MADWISKRVLSSKIPVKLTLADNEVTSFESPPPVYEFINRYTYLPVLAKTSLEYFQHVLPPGDNTVWFDYKGLPLKWQIPAGVLYDLFCDENELPWCLTVHFRSYPTATLLHWEGLHSLRGSFLNSLKEAAYVCRGSSSVVMEMGCAAQEQLWSSVVVPDGDACTEVLQAVQLTPVSKGNRPPSIPLRVFINTQPRGPFPTYSHTCYTSRPMEAMVNGNQYPTLGQAITTILDDLLPTDCGATTAVNTLQGVAVDGDSGEATETVSSPVSRSTSNSGVVQSFGVGGGGGGAGLLSTASVVVCGVQPSLDIPIACLHQQFHAMDWFLYVVVLLPRSST